MRLTHMRERETDWTPPKKYEKNYLTLHVFFCLHYMRVCGDCKNAYNNARGVVSVVLLWESGFGNVLRYMQIIYVRDAR